jgi:Rieske 2Fe-2S family protein
MNDRHTHHDRVRSERPDVDGLAPTLSSADYCADEVFDVDRARIFHRGWMFVGHQAGLAPGHKRALDIAGESIILTRDLAGTFRAFANVCRHRGAQLCEPATASKGSIRCGYHAWTYGLDGALLATPRVDDEFDRGRFGLWPRRADVWNGMVFVSVADEPGELADWIATHSPDLLGFDGLPVADYRIGASTRSVVAANWKILIENYQECLHCAVVHPELTTVIPLYRTGNVIDPDRGDNAVDLAPGADALTPNGETMLANLPGYEGAAEYDGALGFPNMFFDLSPTNLALTAMFPIAPDRTEVVTEYLYHPDEVERTGFDPGGEFELNEMVAAQDATVCEMVQRGVSSNAFTTGVLTAKDAAVVDFVQAYLDIRGPLAPH